MAFPAIQRDSKSPLLSPRMAIKSPSTDTASYNTPPENSTADWSQWMRWDELESDDISAHADLFNMPSNIDEELSNIHKTMVPKTFDLLPVNTPFTFTAGSSNCDTISPQEPPLLSDISPAPSDSLDSTFGPELANGHRNNSVPEIPSPADHAHRNTSERKRTSSSTSLIPLLPTDRKRKAEVADPRRFSAEDDMLSGSKALHSKKRSHNVIEKRYRANLNDKIAELRDSVPSLRALAKQKNGISGQGIGDDDEIVSSSNKLNKASILAKATEYIRHLEQRNKRLEEENVGLKNRLRQLDKVQEQNLTNFTNASGSASTAGAYTSSPESRQGSSPDVFSQAEDIFPESSPNSFHPPEGLIKVPEYFKRMRATGPQQHYAESLNQPSNTNTNYASSGGRRMTLPNKFMLGTLATLMIVGGFENQSKSESSKKGLLGIPLQFPGDISRFVQMYFGGLTATSWQIRALSHFALTSVVVVGAACAVFAYLFNSAPRRAKHPTKSPAGSRSTAGVSPIEFRQEAWLTSIQTVWVPRHTFFPEWFAVTWRCLEYVLSCLLGSKLYSWLTGITEDDEKARAKAWDIAIDAQLTGGDPEVSKSRMVLTIFASGTLPRTPARVMLKALHCRIVLWRVGSPGSWAFRLSNHIGSLLARYQWDIARNLLKNLPKDHEDALPEHLVTLLEADLDDVMTDAITQRASNMAWNRYTQEATYGEDAMLDIVVEDTAVRSPLDALAAWWSSRALQNALIHCLDFDAFPPEQKLREVFELNLDLASNVAPLASAAYTRAAVIKAVFFGEDRVTNINTVLAALPRPKSQPAISSTNFLDSSVPPSARAEISIAVRCAMIAAILKGQVGGDPSTPQLTIRNAIELFNVLPIDPVELTLLGFASLYHLLHVVAAEQHLLLESSLSSSMCSSASDTTSSTQRYEAESTTDCSTLPVPNLSRIAQGLIYWVRNAYNPISSGFDMELVEKAVKGCIDACQRAGIHIEVEETRWEGHHHRATHSKDKTQDTNIVTELHPGRTDVDEESGETENKTKDDRRESLKSVDTGYGSLSHEDDDSDEVERKNIVVPQRDESCSLAN
ncbi:HLH transcription factor [Histoplasma capsulatum var. duboisii H88]|uniref:HLH transcription factor n=1 Tax=Ajellomyces capsulatus (strain H88) TaxID=544711 RepID=F0U7Q3_AJEC8|nr:HLH transcription factor [Histoplasma capsulatum var. duboisii H88]QSS51946.1 HLH transcription factor [Histoplasma capsulatum var. duboisii H88]